MPVIALLTWIIAALGGLYLLAVWLIEYDSEFHTSAATRLPIPAVVAHVLLALVGLLIWAAYLASDSDRLGELAAAILLTVAGLGALLAGRWIGVYRTVPADGGSGAGAAQAMIPPERNFPLAVVIGHGVFAITTLILVLLTVFGVGGS
jgi:hypothetical protein